MIVEMMCCTQVLLDEIAVPQATRKSVALTYALALRSSDIKDWPAINAAILNRWSMSGLTFIKELAWAYVEGRKQP